VARFENTASLVLAMASQMLAIGFMLAI